MNIKKTIEIIVVFIFCLGLSGLAFSEGKIEKPTIFTSPPSYLKEFPLNRISISDAIDVLGMPDKSNELMGKTFLSYELGEGYGKREFVFEVTDGIITDVRYHDQGPYNGQKASEIQKQKIEN